jgi:hypothetical protein
MSMVSSGVGPPGEASAGSGLLGGASRSTIDQAILQLMQPDGYWTFEEAADPVVNHGTAVGADGTWDGTGAVDVAPDGRSYATFDGTNRVDVADQAVWSLPVGYGTVGFFFRRESTAVGSGMVVCKGDPAQFEWQVTISDDHKTMMTHYNLAGTEREQSRHTSVTEINDDEWHMLVMGWVQGHLPDDDDSFRIWLDGERVGNYSRDRGSGSPANGSGRLTWGRRGDNAIDFVGQVAHGFVTNEFVPSDAAVAAVWDTAIEAGLVTDARTPIPRGRYNGNRRFWYPFGKRIVDALDLGAAQGATNQDRDTGWGNLVGKSIADERPIWEGDAITFDGFNDWMDSPTISLGHPGTGFFAQLVNMNRAAVGTIWSLASDLQPNSSYRLFHNAVNGGGYAFVYDDDTNTTQVDLQADASPSGWDIVLVRDRGAAVGVELEVIDAETGLQVDMVSSGAYSTPATTFNKFGIGATARNPPAVFADGQIAELIGLEEVQPADVEADIVKYLRGRRIGRGQPYDRLVEAKFSPEVFIPATSPLVGDPKETVEEVLDRIAPSRTVETDIDEAIVGDYEGFLSLVASREASYALGALPEPDWPTLDEVLAGDLGASGQLGADWLAAWAAQSGELPEYALLVTNADYGLEANLPLDSAPAPNWPNEQEVFDNDLGNQSSRGGVWLAAWYEQSGEATSGYDDLIDDTVGDSTYGNEALYPLDQFSP